jgi:hypothetical protein
MDDSIFLHLRLCRSHVSICLAGAATVACLCVGNGWIQRDTDRSGMYVFQHVERLRACAMPSSRYGHCQIEGGTPEEDGFFLPMTTLKSSDDLNNKSEENIAK